jgi:hypothetical protein
MSRYYGNYNQYLGAQRCCNLNSQGSVGPIGPQGPSSIGPIGNTGPQGISYTGPTGRGCRGPTGPAGNPSGITGPAGPHGPSYWDASGANAIVYTGQVYINGELDVSGGVITTTTPYGVRYNFNPNTISTNSIINITSSYLYQILLCDAFINIILPPTGASGINNGDWVVISNISPNQIINVYQSSITLGNLIYTVPINNGSNISTIKFVYYSTGYPSVADTFYWIVGV